MLRKEFKKGSQLGIDYLSFCLLELIILDYDFFEEIYSNSITEYNKQLINLERLNMIRHIEDKYIPTEQAVKLFKYKDEVEVVIGLYNTLKIEYLGITRASKCLDSKANINQRIKDFGLKFVLETLEAKFILWVKESKMKPHLNSMSTLMKAQGFESWVDKLSLEEKTIINKTSYLE